MSKPAWKVERDRKEAEAKAKKEAEERLKQEKIDAELASRAEQLRLEREKADAEDEAKIQELLRQRELEGIKDTKDEALARANAEREALDEKCTRCNESLANSGPFVRMGEPKKPYHRACLICDTCKEKGKKGVQVVDGSTLECFDCRQHRATSQAVSDSGGKKLFCGKCGHERTNHNAQFCGGCGEKV